MLELGVFVIAVIGYYAAYKAGQHSPGRDYYDPNRHQWRDR